MCGYILGLQKVAYCFWVHVTLTSVLKKSCPDHYLLYYWKYEHLDFSSRNIFISEFGVWILLGAVKCSILFPGHVTLPFGLISRKIVSIVYLLFEVRIPNLVYGYILVSWSVTLCFGITVTLT